MPEKEMFPFLPSMEVVELSLTAHCECEHAHHRLDANSINSPLPGESFKKEMARYTIGERLVLRIGLECFEELKKGNEYLIVIDSSKKFTEQIARSMIADLYLDPRKRVECGKFLSLLAEEFCEWASKSFEAKDAGYKFEKDGLLKLRCEPKREKLPPLE